jgi:ligand-binding SRPBCC domain-containing protein
MMASFVLERLVPAPPSEVFDVSLDVGLHTSSQSRYGERVVGRAADGMLAEGDTVTWSARHFGIRFRMTSLVFDVDRPRRFCDRQVRGPFASFRHVHEFEATDGGTLMRDTVEFRSPLWILGRAVDALVMRRHLTRVISERNDGISRHFT